MRGLATNLLNPKAGIFYIAILPTFVDDTRPLVGQTVTLSFIYVTVATLVHATVVLLADAARPWLEDGRRSMIVRRVLSLLLVGIAHLAARSRPGAEPAVLFAPAARHLASAAGARALRRSRLANSIVLDRRKRVANSWRIWRASSTAISFCRAGRQVHVDQELRHPRQPVGSSTTCR